MIALPKWAWVFLSVQFLLWNGSRLWGGEEKKTGPVSVEDVFETWEQVRLVEQKLSIELKEKKVGFKGTFVLESSLDAPRNAFAFPVRLTKGVKETITVKWTEPETPLGPPIPYVIHVPRPQRVWKRGRKIEKTAKQKEEEEKRRIGERFRYVLDRFTGYRSYEKNGTHRWYAYWVPLKAGKRITLTVQTNWSARPLSNSDQGPCHVFEIPLRLGKMFGAPAGRIHAEIKLPANGAKRVLLIKPKPEEANRTESKITLSYNGLVPDSDLYVVLKDAQSRP